MSYGTRSVSGSGKRTSVDVDLEQLRRQQRDGAARTLSHLGRRAAERVAAVVGRLDCDSGSARCLHPLHEHAETLALPALAPADRVGGRLEALREPDVVELLAGRVPIAFLEEVLEAQLERVGAEPLGEHVHRPLGCPDRLHLPIAPKGAVRREVRVDAARLDRDVGDPVGPRSREAHLLRDSGPAVGVGAGVCPALDLLREERPVGASAQPDPDLRRMAVERQPFLVPLAGRHGRDGRPCEPGRRRSPRGGRTSSPRKHRPWEDTRSGSGPRRCRRSPARSERRLKGVCVPVQTSQPPVLPAAPRWHAAPCARAAHRPS